MIATLGTPIALTVLMIARLAALLAVAALVIGSAASAAPIFPPLVSGEYSFGVRTAAVDLDEDGVPTRAPSRSIQVIELAATGPVPLLCLPAEPDGDVTRVSVVVAASGDRAELRAVAYSELGCAGEASELSDNGAYVFFTPPRPPVLELSP